MLCPRRTRKVSESGLCLPRRHTHSHTSLQQYAHTHPQKLSVIGPPALVCPRTERHSPAVKLAVL